MKDRADHAKRAVGHAQLLEKMVLGLEAAFQQHVRDGNVRQLQH